MCHVSQCPSQAEQLIHDAVLIIFMFNVCLFLQVVPLQRCRYRRHEQGRRHPSHPRTGRYPSVGRTPDQQEAAEGNNQSHASDWKNHLQVGCVVFSIMASSYVTRFVSSSCFSDIFQLNSWFCVPVMLPRATRTYRFPVWMQWMMRAVLQTTNMFQKTVKRQQWT